MNNYVELIEAYSKQISIRDGTTFDGCVGAELMAEREMNILKKRHKPKTNKYSELLELYMTPVAAIRDGEQTSESKEGEVTVKCELCGKTLGYYDKRECGRPLIDGIVCADCKVKCRNYEDAVKASYPDSIQYFPRSSDLED